MKGASSIPKRVKEIGEVNMGVYSVYSVYGRPPRPSEAGKLKLTSLPSHGQVRGSPYHKYAPIYKTSIVEFPLK